mgnify:CR=1 FL=1
MQYSSESIRVLEGLEAVRMRPGMYIGNTGSGGLHHLVNEIIDNSIDEFLAGYCDKIDVIIEKDGSITVCDNGRGIPVDKHEKGISASRIVFTTLHAGGKFDNNSYKVSGGLHGVGAAVVNALSTKFSVTIYKNGYIYKDEYKNGGNPQTKLNNGLLPQIGKTNKTGTEINFLPDKTIFETIEFKPEIIKKRLEELSYLNKGLTLTFYNKRNGEQKETYHSKDGIIGLLKEINKDKDLKMKDVIYLSGKKDDIEVEIAIQYVDDFSEKIISFCNNINTVEGGTHVSGFRGAFTRIINQYARELGVLKEKEANFEGRDVRSGITALISIRHPNPQYEGQTKTKLGNPNARNIVDDIVAREAQIYLDRNLEILKKIIKISMQSRKLRKAEERVKDNILNKSANLAVNGKLASCRKRKPEDIELFIVEGDSAGGSAKQGRDREFQAILPLKGKILNVEKSNMARMLKNTEITTLISTLGCGFGEGLGNDFDIDKLKYGKIIVLTDADVDGSHITTLLLTFFYRYMPELIYEGKVYIGMPPLYKVTKGKKTMYLYSDKELNDCLSRDNDIASIQRFKGLGEMNPEQLWATTLNPKTRVLKQVVIDDSISADSITTTLMGRCVPPRRAFIKDKATMAQVDV